MAIKVDYTPFFLQLIIFTAVIVLFLNVNQLITYFRLSGRPYKSQFFYRKVRHLGIVCTIWTVAILIKFVTTFFGPKAYDIDINADSQDFYTACVIAITSIFTEIVPIYCVLDSKFIKLFSFKHIESPNEDEEVNQSLMLDSRVSNVHNDAPYISPQTARAAIIEASREDTDTFNQSESELVRQGTGVSSEQLANSQQLSPKNSRKGTIKHNMVANLPSVPFDDASIESMRTKLESKLIIKESELVKLKAFTKDWYSAGDKARKNKLGSIFECTMQNEPNYLCRVMNFERISSYQVEGYFSELARLYMYRLTRHVVFPKGLYITEKNEINLIMSKKISLYELIHSMDQINSTTVSLSPRTKIMILQELARIMNTLHAIQPPMAHGHLTSHNVFVQLPQEGDDVERELKVQVSEVETLQLKKYANMFYNYRNKSVWSAPESLSQPKKLSEPTTYMDVYSFGFIMWELLHEKVPFDGDLKAATEYVLKEDVRPLITVEKDDESSDESEEEKD